MHPDSMSSARPDLEALEDWFGDRAPVRKALILDACFSGDGKSVHLMMDVELLPDAVRITFTDDGRPAPVDLTRVAMPDEMSERGRGLAIAYRVLDELSYRRDHDGNHWTLVRRLAE